jgi:hypothetical protein
MVREDPWTRIVDKAGGASAFEAAVRWALADHDETRGDDQWA